MMLDAGKAKLIKLGEELSGGQLFPGLCEDEVMLKLVDKKNEDFIFEMSYRGVKLGTIAVWVNKGGIEGEELS